MEKERSFWPHQVDQKQEDRISRIRQGFYALSVCVETNVGAGHTRDKVLDKLEEACMWAVKGIASEEPVPEKTGEPLYPLSVTSLRTGDSSPVGGAKDGGNAPKPEQPALRDRGDKPKASYKGMIIGECKSCGNVRGFTSKEPISSYRCKACGKETELAHMVQARMYCACCERQWRYMTNVSDLVVEVDCPNCGSPMTAWWNSAKKRYDSK